MGFTNFKIEGRGLGSALILEFLLYYMTKPEYQLYVREELYLDNMLEFGFKNQGERLFMDKYQKFRRHIRILLFVRL